MENLQISHLNFRTQRKGFGITLEEIADEAMLSTTTVRNYEIYGGTSSDIRTRDENEKRICSALGRLIEMRIDSKFVRGKKLDPHTRTNENYDRRKVYDIIKKYLDENHIAIGEFCDMCGMIRKMFTEKYCDEYSTLYPYTLQKICKATGWDISKFDGCKVTVKTIVGSKEEKEEAQMDKTEVNTPVPVAEGGNSIKEEVRDRKFIFEEGCFFEEYVIVRRVRKSITKGAFLAAIEKEKK